MEAEDQGLGQKAVTVPTSHMEGDFRVHPSQNLDLAEGSQGFRDFSVSRASRDERWIGTRTNTIRASL